VPGRPGPDLTHLRSAGLGFWSHAKTPRCSGARLGTRPPPTRPRGADPAGDDRACAGGGGEGDAGDLRDIRMGFAQRRGACGEPIGIASPELVGQSLSNS
jgi:hypothetical protein